MFFLKRISGWWLGHPSEKYEFVSWDDNRNPILMGKIKFMATKPPTRFHMVIWASTIQPSSIIQLWKWNPPRPRSWSICRICSWLGWNRWLGCGPSWKHKNMVKPWWNLSIQPNLKPAGFLGKIWRQKRHETSVFVSDHESHGYLMDISP